MEAKTDVPNPLIVSNERSALITPVATNGARQGALSSASNKEAVAKNAQYEERDSDPEVPS
jgi:hypothetical protein